MTSLNILVTNNHLNTYGGSETFTYALIQALNEKGHNLEYFTFDKGLTSEKIEKKLNVKFFSRKKYDVVFANHNSCVEFLRKKLSPSQIIIQTCHGIYPDLEQPSSLANFHISISEEVKKHLKKLNFESEIILNGIDIQRFKPIQTINPRLKKVLSLCQSDQANSEIEKACKQLNVKFSTLNKYQDPIWNVEEVMNDADLVIGLGRSAYESMACGRPVVIYDNRPYSTSYADGYIDKTILSNALKNNCSGRYYKKTFTVNDLVNEFKKYNPESGLFVREFALCELNITKQADKYLKIYKSIIKSFNTDYLLYFIKKNILFYISFPYCFLKIDTWFLRVNSRKITKKEKKKLIAEITFLRISKFEIKKLIQHQYNLNS